MANTNGGTIYVGVSSDPKEPIVGMRDPKRIRQEFQSEITKRCSPEPGVQIDDLPTQGQQVVRIAVEPGDDPPYALDYNLFYIRDEAETTLAVRDEIVQLVERGRQRQEPQTIVETTKPASPPSPITPPERTATVSNSPAPPRTGVEIVESQKRKNTIYHTVRDLRNGNLIKNVTKSSARKLWHYAISQHEAGLPELEKAKWYKNMAVLNTRRKDEYVWYDLALRENGDTRVFFGVTDSGLNDDWLALIDRNGLLESRD
jgi:hypothetical protein